MKISLFFLGLVAMFLKALGVPYFATASWLLVTSPIWILPVVWIFCIVVSVLFVAVFIKE